MSDLNSIGSNLFSPYSSQLFRYDTITQIINPGQGLNNNQFQNKIHPSATGPFQFLRDSINTQLDQYPIDLSVLEPTIAFQASMKGMLVNLLI